MSIPSDATALGCRRCGRAGAGVDGLCSDCRRELAGDRTILAGDTPPADLTRGDATAGATPPPADAEGTRMAPVGHDDATSPSGLGLSDGATATGNPAAATPSPATGGKAPKPDGKSGPLTIGDRFGRYTIMRLLGAGGMGAVYQAWDQELDVVVALKVIRPEALRDRAAEQEMERRFKRELLLARQVTHKNVVRIHDLGEINGIKYITMSYVDGTDLSTLIKKQGRLPVPMVLRVMKSVVSGLVAAHAADVVHRDLKPANIMIDADGEALIMDFGIARSSGAPQDVSMPTPGASPGKRPGGRYTDGTVLGAIVGTLEYMAPEQARGEPVDHRADIYTTGLILYDLLTGKRRAEHAGSAIEQLKARMEGGVPPITTVVSDLPPALAAIVSRAIEVDPAKRFQTTKELAHALDALDDKGVPKPIKKVVGLPFVAAIILAVGAVSSGIWWYTRPPPPEVAHDPVSVVIADFENRTGDPTFDRTLEPMLRRALEGASFITAYDRNGIRRTVGVALPEKLDEAAARDLAVKQGLGVVLAGVIEKQGGGYKISLKATQTVAGNVVSDVSARAAAADQVLPVATKLVSSVRTDLGDSTSETDQMFAMTSLSAASIDVVRHYATAMEFQSNNKFEDARQSLLKAVQLDPKFGVGYLALAGASRNMGLMQDAQKYIKEALGHIDAMTERERYTTRGMFYRLSLDYQQCEKEHVELIARFAADPVGRNQLALCASKLRNLTRARDEVRAVVDMLPKRVLFRDNLSIYLSYGGDFETAEKEARTVLEIDDKDQFGNFALGFAQMGQGKSADAAETYRKLGALPRQGPTLSASGLGDASAYDGRFNEAIGQLEKGAAADVAANNSERAAAKIAALAYAQLSRGQKAAAITAADKALSLDQGVQTRFLAARIFVEAGQPAKAAAHMKSLSAEIQPEPQAYGKIIEGLVALNSKDARPAIKLFTEANALLDTWIGHFDLGRAYLETGQLPQADSEFDRCLKRRGEAISLFLDEEPTYAFFPPVYYYQGRVREAMKLAGAADSYRAYLAIREKAGEDPRLADIRRRLK
jgi:serine/threonine protein kinase/tetratricopeptide (TPR) repeat protein